MFKIGYVLDYFAGSGTTGHAVINLNREDQGNRKYILVEMGDHFDTVLKPRMQKVVYSPDWKDGKPVSRKEGISHCFKYFRMESYEDALNNLKLTEISRSIPSFSYKREQREEYMLNYLLYLETKDSPSLLDVKLFKDPFQYKMNIIAHQEIHTKNIDLVETFHYLIGLTVERYYEKTKLTFTNTESKKKEECIVRCITGTNRDSEKVLIVWRTIPEDILGANAELKDYLKSNFKLKDFDRIYINGDSSIDGALLLEEHFKRKMFDVQDV